ncbi:optineurin isoform X1 [Gadus morhua]|uniref:Optineurin n=1 Tax=Gadus morhua TaxID=8049 RepID=A0A8C4ZAG2_GADMO|nr:optineurin isoform X1 [Gadus morhua]XP_030197682.1 optineurin isoform X1 [Gadus morhua]
MATGSPIINGDVPPGHSGTLEETVQQINVLIQENRDLKDSLQKSNQAMKERFEGLSAWREKQQEERGLLESSLEKATSRLEAVTAENQELRTKLEELSAGGKAKSVAETDALCAQVARLQAEKNDLLAINSELQVNEGRRSEDDSFIEIITFMDGEEENNGAESGEEKKRRELEASKGPNLTVHELLQSLRDESQRAGKLQEELQASESRVAGLQGKMICSDSSSQTSLPPETPKTTPPVQDQAVSEVENLRAQMLSLFNELQQAQNKLDEAEGMKKGLQDRCREVEHEVATLQAQLVEKQAVQAENEQLRLRVDSMTAQGQMEQRKIGEEKKNHDQLKVAYTKLYQDHEALKTELEKKESESVPSSVLDDLGARLTAAEEALVHKQDHIDEMKQEIFQKEKELETISVFQAQADVYSSDFYAERAAREKIHEEKEHLATELDFTKKLNRQLQDELESLGRHSLFEMKKRHLPAGGNPHGGAAAQGGRGGDGRDWQQQVNIPEHVCPKCNVNLPDLDSLQIHIMDCII